jgi:hypothetical protein
MEIHTPYAFGRMVVASFEAAVQKGRALQER